MSSFLTAISTRTGRDNTIPYPVTMTNIKPEKCLSKQCYDETGSVIGNMKIV